MIRSAFIPLEHKYGMYFNRAKIKMFKVFFSVIIIDDFITSQESLFSRKHSLMWK